MGTSDGLKVIFGIFTGLLPYFALDRDLAALPYMTRDFIKMKKEERRQATTLGKKAFYTFYIYMVQVFNIIGNPVLVHL